ncbi:MAG TPA: PEP-CTERM sorting domain-containing protein [candidate division Zixibacteria bacterium]|nr:PEP-CTERM sorting domain-containing protein [candidate division Zixibacteria bacterium]MDD4916865.1 PEP-CTERM sorting domain-containing protein [candidate division Zixibacteria bacterium]MDM7971453.1 PEP-CTERM sorting domain-containing protein [candidate division Zixibacteria bacterium]HOD65133.1 PEP-CTERM sorting domain-containing protein [candidate division Zixibacteria bacterium]HOZ08443.1 PEP-CTERM sorting domain-containing protein [candidate division Zixibacteria bacterium]
MKVSHDTHSNPMKWVIAVIIFVIVLTVAFDDVFGVWIPQSDNEESVGAVESPDVHGDAKVYSDEPPPQVPEPGTLILLGAGLAAMRLLRPKKA